MLTFPADAVLENEWKESGGKKIKSFSAPKEWIKKPAVASCYMVTMELFQNESQHCSQVIKFC